jgi:hypothetical protein
MSLYICVITIRCNSRLDISSGMCNSPVKDSWTCTWRCASMLSTAMICPAPSFMIHNTAGGTPATRRQFSEPACYCYPGTAICCMLLVRVAGHLAQEVARRMGAHWAFLAELPVRSALSTAAMPGSQPRRGGALHPRQPAPPCDHHLNPLLN